MNTVDALNKALLKNSSDAKGWRKAFASAQGSYSRDFAQKNLHRLKAEQEEILNHLKTLELRRQQVMKTALRDGIITDHVRDGVCERLVADGWLDRMDAIPNRGGKPASKDYLPTNKATENWQIIETKYEEENNSAQ